jgi:hypothetical protein
MSTDIIIGCADMLTWDQLQYWVQSVNASGFRGEKCIVVLNEDKKTIDKLRKHGCHVVAGEWDADGNSMYYGQWHVVVERFLRMHDVIDVCRHRYVIATDVRDVIFQEDPTKRVREFLDMNPDKDLIVTSESIRYKDELWGTNNFTATFGRDIAQKYANKIVYNAGVLAGRARAMKDLFLNVYAMSIHRKIHNPDQAALNFLIDLEPYRKTILFCDSEDGFAAQLGTTGDPRKADLKITEPRPMLTGDGIVTTSQGKPYVVVHQYDRNPTVREVMWQRFAEPPIKEDPSTVAFVMVVYKNARAVRESVRKVREHYATEPVYIFETGSLDSQALVVEFQNIRYYHTPGRIFEVSPGHPYAYLPTRVHMQEFVDCFKTACATCDATWIMNLEPDVFVQRRIQTFPEDPDVGCASVLHKFNKFEGFLTPGYESLRQKNYGCAGGALIRRTAFLEAAAIGLAVNCILGSVGPVQIQHGDVLLSFLVVQAGYRIQDFLELAEPMHHSVDRVLGAAVSHGHKDFYEL